MLIVVSDYLTTAKQCLTIFSFQNLGNLDLDFLGFSIRWSKNNKGTIEKAETLKILIFNPFITYIVLNT